MTMLTDLTAREVARNSLLRKITNQHGSLDNTDLSDLARFDRLRPVLIRCGGGRLTCPAQDANHWINIIEASTGAHDDYVRDVSLPATDPTYTQS